MKNKKQNLTDILIKALLGKKIKLYKVLDKTHNPDGDEYCVADKSAMPHPQKSEIIKEIYGTIKSIETNTDTFEGDSYNIVIIDEKNKPIHYLGLNSITSYFELMD